ncbi:CO/xanthine dehydrogenase FAD-binding subunit [Bradyrhizobium liaoningense]
MKPAPFAYERPRDLTAALSMLAAGSGSAKIIAGGQSLGPMLNLRLVQPELIVDISGLAELKRAEISGGELVLGALVTHADIEDGRTADVTRGAMRGVAANIAYRAVRNRGTIGGSLSPCRSRRGLDFGTCRFGRAGDVAQSCRCARRCPSRRSW